MSIDLDTVVSRLRDAVMEDTPSLAVRDVLDELTADPHLADGLPAVTQGGIVPLHNSDELTVLQVAWTPGMRLYPHDHAMWAVIGMYAGREDNAFYRRSPNGLESAGGRQVDAGDVLVLGREVIHSVANTRQEFAVALHVYGGDFFKVPRSEWDFETLTERPLDLNRTRQLFEEANQEWRAQKGQ